METIAREIQIWDGSGEHSVGTLFFNKWSESERKKRAFQKTFKIVGGVFAVSLIGLFVHVLLLFIIPALALTILFSVPLYFRFVGENETLVSVEGTCPNCRENTKLKPYLNAKIDQEMTVQCSQCGQTCRCSSAS